MTSDYVLARADAELDKGNGAESCPICYALIRDLAAEVRRLDGMRCETCLSAIADWKGEMTNAYCKKLSRGHGTRLTMCADVGGGCLAWEKRDDK